MADTNYYVDSVSGNNADTGLTQALAFETLDYALSLALGEGDIVWVRRGHSEVLTSDLAPGFDGQTDNPFTVSGWPRPAILNTTITQATWVNGSTLVDDIVGITVNREQHLGRFITAPNGSKYLITMEAPTAGGADSFQLDCEYAGASVSTTAGKFQIEADDNYSDRPADVDGWDSDPHDLPLIDGNSLYEIQVSDEQNYLWKNLDFLNCLANSIRDGAGFTFQGCLFHTHANNACITSNGYTAIQVDRCIFRGTSAGNAQRACTILAGSMIFIKNSAIYDMGDNGIYSVGGGFYLENVNIGVEVANQDDDIGLTGSGYAWGKDVALGGTNGLYGLGQASAFNRIEIENYGKVLGAHIVLNGNGTITKLDVVAGSGNPYKRTGGADSVLDILYNLSPDLINYSNPADIMPILPIIEHEIEATTDSKSYRYYIQSDGALTIDNLWMELEYVDSYDDTSEYTKAIVKSDETISARADAEDWTQYIEVTGIVPAVASKVRIKVFCSYYNATNNIYIDPMVVIS